MDETMKKFVGDSEVLFATNLDMRMAQEQIVIKVSSGREDYVFAFHPLHAKRVMILLQENIKEYEKVLGELKTDILRGVPSPIQPERK